MFVKKIYNLFRSNRDKTIEDNFRDLIDPSKVITLEDRQYLIDKKIKMPNQYCFILVFIYKPDISDEGVAIFDSGSIPVRRLEYIIESEEENIDWENKPSKIKVRAALALSGLDFRSNSTSKLLLKNKKIGISSSSHPEVQGTIKNIEYFKDKDFYIIGLEGYTVRSEKASFDLAEESKLESVAYPKTNFKGFNTDDFE